MTPTPAEHALTILAPAVDDFEEARPSVEKLYHPQTQQEADWASHIADVIAAEVKDIEERWETVTKPLYQAHQAACALRRPAIEPRKAAIIAIKAGVGEFLDRSSREAEEALALAAASGSAEAIANVEAPQVPKGLSAKVKRGYKVVDFDAVPMKYKMVTLNHALLAFDVDHGVEAIPGVEIEVKTEIRRTGGKRGVGR